MRTFPCSEWGQWMAQFESWAFYREKTKIKYCLEYFAEYKPCHEMEVWWPVWMSAIRLISLKISVKLNYKALFNQHYTDPKRIQKKAWRRSLTLEYEICFPVRKSAMKKKRQYFAASEIIKVIFFSSSYMIRNGEFRLKKILMKMKS